MISAAAATVLSLSVVPLVTGLDNGAGRTPVLGWSTWQTCGDTACSHDACTETEIKSVAVAMAANGMLDIGWDTISLDDCWVAETRAVPDGPLGWDVTRFPSGIPALVQWLAAKGFKLGLYTSAGNTTCTGRPGSRGHYEADAAAFAAWGVKYIKLDWCGDIKDEVAQGAPAHRAFAAAVNRTGSPIFIEVVAGYFFLGPAVGEVANSWRFCTDHQDLWKSTAAQLDCRLDQGQLAGSPGAWASMDFLMTGGAGCAAADHCPGQTDDEYKTEFVLWSLTQSSMIVDTDVRNMTAVMRHALLNPELIEPFRSTMYPPGRHLGYWAGCTELLACHVWGRQVGSATSGWEWLVALVNTGSKSHRITAEFKLLGWDGATAAAGRDPWLHAPLPNVTGAVEATVPPHGTEVILLKRLRP